MGTRRITFSFLLDDNTGCSVPFMDTEEAAAFEADLRVKLADPAGLIEFTLPTNSPEIRGRGSAQVTAETTVRRVLVPVRAVLSVSIDTLSSSVMPLMQRETVN